jgi:hypothetical protein
MLPALIPELSFDELMKRADAGRLRGVYRVTNADYHDGPGLSSTSIKEILKSPAHLRGAEWEEKDSFRLGSAIHAAMLEPDVFERDYVVWTGATRSGKAWEAAAKIAAETSQTILTLKEKAIVDAAVERFAGSTVWRHFTRGAEYEVAAYATDPETGVLMKAKLDVINEDLEIGDIKSTALCVSTPEVWMREVFNRGYHVSAAYYLDVWALALGFQLSSFIWAVIEKAKPFGLRFFVCPGDYIVAGRKDYRKALVTFAQCQKEDAWPAYADEFTEMPAIPYYIAQRYEA